MIKFLDHTLRVGQIHLAAEHDDFVDLFNIIDATRHGYITRTAMWHWLKSLASLPVPVDVVHIEDERNVGLRCHPYAGKPGNPKKMEIIKETARKVNEKDTTKSYRVDASVIIEESSDHNESVSSSI